jgi:hypothetical protein
VLSLCVYCDLYDFNWDKSTASIHHQVAISSIFYEQLFHLKVFCAAFMCLQFVFVIFRGKDFGAKAAHKMLVKLPPGGSMVCIYVFATFIDEKSETM